MNNSKVDAPDLIIPPVSFEKKKMIFSSKKETFVTSSTVAFPNSKTNEKTKPKTPNQVNLIN